jgi:hypothetical protein
LTADPSSLTAGTYEGSIVVSDGQTSLNVSVTLVITDPKPSILLSQTGLNFTTVALGGNPLSQSFGILNTGKGIMDWSLRTTTLSGGTNWLRVSATSGNVQRPFLDVSTIDVSIDQTGLEPGEYYGRIEVDAASDNSPQFLTVILKVLPTGQKLAPEVRPNGLIFVSAAGSIPGSQDVMLGNPTPRVTHFNSASTGPLSYLPITADVLPGRASILRVFPDLSSQRPGQIQYGAILLLFDDGTIQTIRTLTVVAPEMLAEGDPRNLSGSTTHPSHKRNNIQAGPQGPRSNRSSDREASPACANLNLIWRTPLNPRHLHLEFRRDRARHWN